MANKTSEEGAIKTTVNKIKKVKHIEIIIAVVAVLIMLAIYFGGMGGGRSDEVDSNQSTVNYCIKLQNELEELIGKLSGAGDARVLISWESSIELILAQSTQNSTSSTNSSPVIIQGSNGSSPVVLKEIYPKAMGVLIICQGANDTKLKVNIIMAVATLLDISQDKVMVYAMSK